MAKKLLGIDIGASQLKLAVVKGSKIGRTAVVEMPEKLVKDGQLVSIETMGELLRKSIKKNKLHCREAAVIINGENVFTRSITMPLMSHEQLMYNLPYEFRDYISEDTSKYCFDYSIVSTKQQLNDSLEALRYNNENPDSEPKPSSMELFGVAAPKEQIEEIRMMLRKAGVRLFRVSTNVSAYGGLIRQTGSGFESKEFCFLDLGFKKTRLFVFKGDNPIVTRELEIGIESVVSTIADFYNVDVHLAHTYLLTNHDNCQNSEVCRNAFGTISIELMRAFNFFRFSNPDSQVEDIYLVGGGTAIAPLRESIENTLSMKIHPISDLLNDSRIDDAGTLALAIGIAIK